MRIERIVITGDVFRTTNGDPNQLSNARWLRGEVSRLLYELTGLWPDVRYRRNAPDGGRALVTEWYRLLGHAPSVDAWAATYAQTIPPPALIDVLHPDYDRALVIGFELSPLMRSVLNSLGAPWIDVELSPIRFLDDLVLDLRFSWPVALAHPGLVSDCHLDKAVARMRARHRNDASATDLHGACVFLAQTRYDRSLIKCGGFFSDSEAIECVAQSLDGRPLVIKPHPLAPDNPLLAELQQRFAALKTDANIYALLATASDAHFLTISSSAAIEARHFGHTPAIFHAKARADTPPLSSLWAHRSTAFWRSALEPLLPIKAAPDVEHREIPDRLRHSLGSWGWPAPQERLPAPTRPTARAAPRSP